MLLPLEEWLQEKAKRKPTSFPNRDQNYFNLYDAQKAKFSQHIYPHVNSAMTVLDGPRVESGSEPTVYTDHGIGHTNAVIETAGRLLGCSRKNSRLSLEPYEVYLLLMTILSHDAGNIEGRRDHQMKIYKLLDQRLTKVLDDTVEMREIHDIAQSHTGKGIVSGLESKDTIVSLGKEKTLSSIVYHPRRIAALLRFADEICEDRKRIPEILLNNPSVSSGPSVPYLRFGQSITSVDILKDRQSIRIQFDLQPEHVLRPLEFVNNEGQIQKKYLIDVVMSRLGKIRRERSYCFRFLHGVVEFASVTADINVIEEADDGNFRAHPMGTIDMSEADYPSEIDDRFLSTYPTFSGEALRDRVSGTLELTHNGETI